MTGTSSRHYHSAEIKVYEKSEGNAAGDIERNRLCGPFDQAIFRTNLAALANLRKSSADNWHCCEDTARNVSLSVGPLGTTNARSTKV
jgi:hypothetical protein